MKAIDARSNHVSPLLRIFVILVVPLLIGNGIIFYWRYSKEKADKLFSLNTRVEHQLLTQKAIISRFSDNMISDLRVLSNYHELIDIVNRGPNSSTENLIHDLVQFSGIRRIYDQIRYIDASGNEIIRIDFNNGFPRSVTKEKLQNKKERYYFKNTLKLSKYEVFISPMDLNMENGRIEIPVKPMIRIGTPVFDKNHQKTGVLVLNYLADQLLESLSESDSSLGEHTLMLNKDGYFLKGTSGSEEWGFMYENKNHITFDRLYPGCWNNIKNARKGSFINESGIFSFDTVFPLKHQVFSWNQTTGEFTPSNINILGDQYHWKLVHFISHDDFNLRIKNGERIIIALALITSLAIITGSWFLALLSYKRKKTEKALKIAHDDLENEVELRTRELNCLFRMSETAGNLELDIDQILELAILIIPTGYRFPDITQCRITFDEKVFQAEFFDFYYYTLESDLIINGKIRGTIEVSYSQKKEKRDEGPFLKEERSLNNVLARHLSNLIQIREGFLEKEKLKEQLRHSQKIEAIGTLAGGIAHDFNNILSGITGYCQLAVRHLDNPQIVKQDIDRIFKGALRASELVQQILSFSRKSEIKKQPVFISHVLKEALQLLSPLAPSSIEIKQDITSQSSILADSSQIHQVIMNLCTNAIHAMDATDGVLSIALTDIDPVELDDIPDGNTATDKYVALEVKDTGCGMDSETLEKVFDPYFTTKEAGRGTGLGLTVTGEIIGEHNGHIKIFSEPGQGTTVKIYFPVYDSTIAISDLKKEKQKQVHKFGRIMLIDDESDIRTSTQALLEENGYRVMSFNNGLKAFEIFKKSPDRFDLIITDMMMPKITGQMLSKMVLNIRPDIPIFLWTGGGKNINEKKLHHMGIRKLIQKPININDLVTLIDEVLMKQNQIGKGGFLLH